MGRQYRNTKENIFGEAVKLFSEQGYNATTMRQIASATGVNEATIYIYFDNKEALMDEILQVFRAIPKRYIPSRTKIDAFLEEEPPRQLLSRFIPYCRVEDANFLTRAYRIVYAEQLINPKASALVQDHLVGEVAENLVYTLDKLVERGELPGLESPKYSTAWSCKQFSTIWANNMFTKLCLNGFPDSCERVTDENGIVFMCMYLIEMAIDGKDAELHSAYIA